MKRTITTYHCDVCQKEIPKISNRKLLTVEYANISKRSIDLCTDCGNEFAIKYGLIDPTDVEKEKIPCPYCNGQGRHGSTYRCPWGGQVHPDQMICPKCGHSKSHHFDGSYNKDASEADGISECGMELQFVCGCSSLEFKRAADYHNHPPIELVNKRPEGLCIGGLTDRCDNKAKVCLQHARDYPL